MLSYFLYIFPNCFEWQRTRTVQCGWWAFNFTVRRFNRFDENIPTAKDVPKAEKTPTAEEAMTATSVLTATAVLTASAVLTAEGNLTAKAVLTAAAVLTADEVPTATAVLTAEGDLTAKGVLAAESERWMHGLDAVNRNSQLLRNKVEHTLKFSYVNPDPHYGSSPGSASFEVKKPLKMRQKSAENMKDSFQLGFTGYFYFIKSSTVKL